MKFILFTFIFFCSSFNVVFAEIKITDFEENIRITDFGREVRVRIKAIVELPSMNQYYKWWSYVFSKDLKVEVSEAKVIGRQYKTSFGNNTLRFDFNEVFNGDLLEFQFKYIQFNDDIDNQYTRHEPVSISPFAKGGHGSIVFEIPDNLNVYSLNPNFIQYGNTFKWSGKIPEKGFSDIFSLTLKNAKWSIKINNTISSQKTFSKIKIQTPPYFKNANNTIEDYRITTNFPNNSKIESNNNENIIELDNIETDSVSVLIDSIFKNNSSDKNWIKLDQSKYLKIDNKLSMELYNIIYKLQLENKNNEPLYILIAKWVHNSIKYDINYLTKEMDSLKIISTGRGVCSHYAQLYNDMMRTIGTPSLIVSGISYDTEKKSFEDHAWNMIYVNGEWVFIDPTWGIYSGKLPISHIFFFFENRPVINYTVYSTSSSDFKSSIEKDVEWLE